MKTFLAILLVCVMALGLSSCEDAVPSTYIPRYAVEAFLIVGEPIDHIKLFRTQAVEGEFSTSASIIADADVRIMTETDTMQLQFKPTAAGGEYFYPGKDTVYKVQPNTVYWLRIRTGSSTITARTITPGLVAFTRTVDDTLYYPKDTIRLSVAEKMRLGWTPVPGIEEYLLRIRALDTLGYGKYLTPPTEEKNRRVYRFWEKDAPDYNDVTRWGFIPATDIPGSWAAFKWFGLQEVTVFAADNNLVNWFKLTKFGSSPTYNSLLGSVQGDDAIGVFASASTASDTTFVIKNQP